MSLALSTLLFEWRRYMAAIVALAAAGVLVLGMCGLFVGLISGFTANIDRSRADIMVLPPNAKSLNNSGGLPARILPLIYVQPEVAEVRDLDEDWGRFFGPGKHDPTNVQVSIVDTMPGAVTLPVDYSEATRQALSVPFNIAIDRSALKKLGVKKGDSATFRGQVVRVGAILEGYPSLDNPVIVMSRQTLRQMGRANTSTIGPLLVRLKDPSKATQVRDSLNALADKQYRAWTKKELHAATLDSFLNESIIAIFMYGATGLGLFIGVIITWQTLQGAILADIKELASLRALGISMGSLRGIVMELSFWVGIAGMVFTAGVMALLFLLTRFLGMPFGFITSWVITVVILLMVIALLSGFFSLGVLKKSQPADLLR